MGKHSLLVVGVSGVSYSTFGVGSMGPCLARVRGARGEGTENLLRLNNSLLQKHDQNDKQTGNKKGQNASKSKRKFCFSTNRHTLDVY